MGSLVGVLNYKVSYAVVTCSCMTFKSHMMMLVNNEHLISAPVLLKSLSFNWYTLLIRVSKIESESCLCLESTAHTSYYAYSLSNITVVIQSNTYIHP